jgi:hypothetical protein
MKWKDLKDKDVPEWLRNPPEMLEVSYVKTSDLAEANLRSRQLLERVQLMHRILNIVIPDILFITNGRESGTHDHTDRGRYSDWSDYTTGYITIPHRSEREVRRTSHD